MSQNLESPGFADAKMDISSEATSQSQESPGVISPDDDGEPFQQRDLTTLSNEETDDAQRYSCGVPKSRSYTRSGLTLTSSHPLQQSPTVTDSDSENGHHRATKRFVFPDVVPENEATHRKTQPATTTTTRATISSLDIVDNPHGRRKVMRDLSPERMGGSSGSEQDLSQYQASVTPSFQAVALVARPIATSSSQQQRKHTKVLPQDQLSDVSSVESLSNRSFDDDFDPDVISGSPVSSLFDNNLHEDATREDCAEQSTTDSARPKHKIVLPDGRMREIDMKVIEPYKRVLSHGGYLKTAGHNAIIIFSACYLPDRSRMDYHYVMDNLFLYVVQTLEQLVTDDYVMIYLHGGCCKNNVPPFHWLRKCYQLLDRRLRKSLKTLYMVHPTFWLKSLVIMSRPFISSKFWRKFIYVKNLEDLYEMVPVEKAAIPEKVKQFNSRAT
ncbi:protein prune homolog 2 [Lutzomyia longipalpis]|uniref:protein prune homolog 2 n=1 Tax=Lutzomyia longipalpis TaxID=7200 RepID=UPI002483FC8D|nr:protein prune homolog 2 [Lutzomyia longipalpis]